MPKETEPERLKLRKEYIVNMVNRLDRKGFKTSFAIKIVAKKLFLSKNTVQKDYYGKY